MTLIRNKRSIKRLERRCRNCMLSTPNADLLTRHANMLLSSLSGRSDCSRRSASDLTGQSMVRQAHHDTCHPEPVEGWIPRSRDCVVITLECKFVILNEVKNLIRSMCCTTEILRPWPQNDIATQPPSRGITSTEDSHVCSP